MEFPNLLGKKVVHCKIKKGQNFEGKSCRTEKRNETGETGEGLAKNGIYFRWKKKSYKFSTGGDDVTTGDVPSQTIEKESLFGGRRAKVFERFFDIFCSMAGLLKHT
jgi:hypothetical protein